MYSYHLKNGPRARSILRTDARHKDYCVYRDLLEPQDRFGPVDVFKLRKGRTTLPATEVVEKNVLSERCTPESEPERGGLCRYFMPSTRDFCPFCLGEVTRATAMLEWQQARKKVGELEKLYEASRHKWRSRITAGADEGEDCSYVHNRYYGKCANTHCLEPQDGYPGCCCPEDVRAGVKMPWKPPRAACWHEM